MLPLPPFAPLIDTSEAITAALNQTKGISIADGYQSNAFDAAINSRIVPALDSHSRLDRAALLEAAFKLNLTSIQDELGTDFEGLKDAMFRCLDILLRCAELHLVDATIPLNYIEEVLDYQTVEFSMQLYDYLEARVERLTENMVSGKGKGLTLLRMCNELLRRLSKAKNTVFCGRILMLLSSVFPITERSGVNLKGDFHTDNVTLVESEDITAVQDMSPSHSRKDDASNVPNGTSMDVDEDTKNTTQDDRDAVKKELSFYTEFWSLQGFFCNPALLINSPTNMAKLQTGIEHALAKFSAAEEVNQKDRGQRTTSPEPDTITKTSTESSSTAKRKHSQLVDDDATEPTTYFPKFLTSPKLLQLEIADPYFRKHILVQFLITLQYLEGHNADVKDHYAKIRTPNKMFQPQWILEDKDQQWIETIKPRIFNELKASGQESGDEDFANTVKTVLHHEENWIQWKAESCPAFERPSLTEIDAEETLKKRQKLSASLAPLKQKLGCRSLTELWKQVDEQMDEGVGIGSIHPPQAVDEYLSGLPFAAKRAQAMRLREGKPPFTEQETKELSQARLWRGLRLGARQYIHLYGKFVVDSTYSVANLTADIKEDERFEEEVKENGGKVPKPKVAEKPRQEDASTKATTEDAATEANDADVDMEQADATGESTFKVDEPPAQDRADSTASSPGRAGKDTEPESTEAQQAEKAPEETLQEEEPIVISLTKRSPK
ncbi:hypothetical protein BGZ99_000645 [Dissophora globulifera]|uniref:THO complex subunit 1 n=1 Tax=Dissophora globulifera TaxID=979702 RepID=A0A9P6R341_9FUNG|nr:hypothetical protein BGZ99_000645 [Dissophora globulifera]